MGLPKVAVRENHSPVSGRRLILKGDIPFLEWLHQVTNASNIPSVAAEKRLKKMQPKVLGRVIRKFKPAAWRRC